ncbi:MAG TPA: hypothetical protein VLL05_06480 [Terriglobales bacterium]|nr:hypothetical protein [Terriglobales bacterium]
MEQPNSQVLKMRSSNAGPLAALLLGLILPAIVWSVVAMPDRLVIWLCIVAVSIVFLALFRIDIFELDKGADRCVFRSIRMFGMTKRIFRLREIERVNIKHRTFNVGYRSHSNPYAFQLTVTMTSGAELTLTGWQASLNVQQRGFALAEFLSVPFDTMA